MSTAQDVESFWKYTKAAMEQATLITAGRKTSRDLVVTPWAKMVYGLESYITLIFHKAARLASMATSFVVGAGGSLELTAETSDKIDDELLDIINYAAMAWAFRKLERDKALEEEKRL